VAWFCRHFTLPLPSLPFPLPPGERENSQETMPENFYVSFKNIKIILFIIKNYVIISYFYNKFKLLIVLINEDFD